MRPVRSLSLALLIAWGAPIVALGDPSQVMRWTIDGKEREAIVIPPERKGEGPIPVLLVFHGHGGTMRSMERQQFQHEWREALVVCPQGLPTSTGRDPEGKRSGWQQNRGADGDRDLKFVDAILKTLRESREIDDDRIYATGHSNGGGFTYLLWAARGTTLAAIAPSSAGASGIRSDENLKALPVLHLAGEQDAIVKFANQQRTMQAVRDRNDCDKEGKPWAKAGKLVGTIYPSRTGKPFVSVIHPGTHKYPDEAPGLIVKFFKENARNR